MSFSCFLVLVPSPCHSHVCGVGSSLCDLFVVSVPSLCHSHVTGIGPFSVSFSCLWYRSLLNVILKFLVSFASLCHCYICDIGCFFMWFSCLS